MGSSEFRWVVLRTALSEPTHSLTGVRAVSSAITIKQLILGPWMWEAGNLDSQRSHFCKLWCQEQERLHYRFFFSLYLTIVKCFLCTTDFKTLQSKIFTQVYINVTIYFWTLEHFELLDGKTTGLAHIQWHAKVCAPLVVIYLFTYLLTCLLTMNS